ncbi:carbon-nitrogen hydrolase family protein [Streptomyces sp. TRM 70351]|uniref:carbon-nitrogen hydrolase family protein n=1 Tax=Streptomyces sp. TRM 70351 TaxID=3116552 RepID=UPI002E7B9795|nr:carbon-nitrogen hydrolase family protein [Streptomyces sp. TRM 70351]MEE1929520.1 carbon-nitrogen hydrolase family protein [Streptomyces sp. TRM 70351]
MTTLTVALLQLDPVAGYRWQDALAAGEEACRAARRAGADVALFPEMWSNGYGSAVPPELDGAAVYRHPQRWGEPAPEPDAVWCGEAVGADSPYVRRFGELAAELRMAVAVTYLEAWDGPPRNTVTLFDRNGTRVLTQAKVHTCAFGYPEAVLTPGSSFAAATLDTAAGPVRVGAMICYDREFPESARALMLDGAELLLVPNACELEVNRTAQLRARAFENMTAVAVANYAGPGFGHSVAFDGIAFDGDGSRDMLTVEADERPGVYLAPFDLAALRDYRQRETWGDAFRRPSAYGRLTGGDVAAPFVRTRHDGRRLPR